MYKFTIVGLGEVLWDVSATGKQLGGAPANFAYISSLLGDEGVVASRIGADELGEELVARLQLLGLGTSHLQRDAQHSTGTVEVEISSDGQPSFEITQGVAWDFLEWTPELEALAQRTDAVCFGSLAQRNLLSRETIQRFLGATRANAIRVFDVNLRQEFFSAEVLAASVNKASILKLNNAELPTFVRILSGPCLGELPSAQWLCSRYNLRLVCITRGAFGSLLVTRDAHHEHPGHRVKVIDTIGSGDAFTATLLHHLLHGSDLATMNDAANRIGAWVASKAGATPIADQAEIRRARAVELRAP